MHWYVLTKQTEKISSRMKLFVNLQTKVFFFETRELQRVTNSKNYLNLTIGDLVLKETVCCVGGK